MESLFGRRGRSASFEEDDGESSFTFLELFSVVELELPPTTKSGERVMEKKDCLLLQRLLNLVTVASSSVLYLAVAEPRCQASAV